MIQFIYYYIIIYIDIILRTPIRSFLYILARNVNTGKLNYWCNIQKGIRNNVNWEIVQRDGRNCKRKWIYVTSSYKGYTIILETRRWGRNKRRRSRKPVRIVQVVARGMEGWRGIRVWKDRTGSNDDNENCTAANDRINERQLPGLEERERESWRIRFILFVVAALDGPPVVTRAPKVSLIRETIVPRSFSTRHRAGGGGGNYVLFLSKKSTRFRTRDKITYSLRPLSLSLSPFRNVRLSVRVFAEVGGGGWKNKEYSRLDSNKDGDRPAERTPTDITITTFRMNVW